MGKISEALKKAGKKDRSRPLDQEEKGLRLEKANAAPNNKEMPEQSWRTLSEDRNASKIDNAAVSAKSPAMVEKPVPILQAHTPSLPEDNDADADTIKKQDDAIAVDQVRRTREHENTNIAVVRTPRADKATPSMPSVETPAHEVKQHAHLRGVKTTSGRAIQISYSETQVQAFDPEKLKNNKIFSMFDDIETTDQIKILRTQVLKKLAAIGGNSILVTSANPYEGKTFTSINLGVSIAKEFDRTVLIIDADLRKPTKRHTAFSTEFFSLDVEFGLTDYLKGEADIPDILINPGISKLTLIPSGKPVDNAPELLNSNRMQEMMSEIKSRYASDRLVIVDGPAMLPFPDVMILSRYVDGVLPVVEIERTPVDQLKKMMDSLKDTRILGTVLNKNKG